MIAHHLGWPLSTARRLIVTPVLSHRESEICPTLGLLPYLATPCISIEKSLGFDPIYIFPCDPSIYMPYFLSDLVFNYYTIYHANQALRQ